MTASDTKTAHLHRSLSEHMDPETADALIERLPPDWEQVATKADLAEFATKADLAQFATKADLAQLETKMGALESTVSAKMVTLGTELRGEMATLRTDLSRDLRVVMFTIVGFALAVVGMFATILVSGVPAAG